MNTPDGTSVKLIVYVLVRKSGRVYLVRYKSPPNGRAGWWLPAPELGYGEHPEDARDGVLKSLGLEGCPSRLAEVESFTTRDWHLVFHYVVDADRDPSPGPEFESGQWFDPKSLPGPKDFAHGGWEPAVIARLA